MTSAEMLFFMPKFLKDIRLLLVIMEELSQLPPEERIRKLKKRQEEMKKAIADAQKKIKESEEELEREQLLREHVPIPAVAAESVNELTTEEEKAMFRVKRFISERDEKEATEEERNENEGTAEREEEETLEGVVHSTTTGGVPPDKGHYGAPIGSSDAAGEYIRRLSQEPAENLYRSMAQIEEDIARQGGYVTAEQQRNIQYISSAMEQKMQDAEAGRYTLTEEVEQAFSAIQQMKDAIKDAYKRGDSAEMQYRRVNRF
jgi:hypothetical protein